jgi:hypothetical protein
MSCSFAILKRGLFLLLTDLSEARDSYHQWEVFVRQSPFGVRRLAWNIDNFYVALIDGAVLLLSLLAWCFALYWLLSTHTMRVSPNVEMGILIAIAIAYAIPIWSIAQLSWLARVCLDHLPPVEASVGRASPSDET